MTQKVFRLTIAAVIVAAASAQAQDASQFSADFTGMTGRIVMDDIYDPSDSFSKGTSQALSFRLRSNFGEDMFGQVDYSAEDNADGNGYSYVSNGVALHLGKTTGDMTIGGMLSQGHDGAEGVSYNTLAVEADKKTASGLLSGQVGLILSKNGDEQAIYGRVAYAKDLNEKTTVTASLGLGIWDYYSDKDQHTYLGNLGLEAQYKVSDKVAILAAFQGNMAAEPHEDEYWNSGTLYVGMRVSLGAAAKPAFADYNPLYGIQSAKFTDYE